MSKYTITIKNLIDNDFDFQMTSYPIFDEEYRETLNNNILNYYYEDEIGFETAPLFRKYLNSTLNRIMPKYNIMYQAQKDLASNLYNNINITEMTKTTNESTTSNDSNTSSNSHSTSTSSSQSQATQDAKNLYQDTPQGKITQSDINSQTWATNVTFDNSSNSGTASSENSVNDESTAQGNSTQTGNSTQDYIRTLVGTDRTPYIDQYQKIVQNLKNIDDLIIQELSDLFMQIY